MTSHSHTTTIANRLCVALETMTPDGKASTYLEVELVKYHVLTKLWSLNYRWYHIAIPCNMFKLENQEDRVGARRNYE